MTTDRVIPLVVFPIVCAVLGYLVTSMMIPHELRVAFGALLGLIVFGIGLSRIAIFDQHGWQIMLIPYLWFGIWIVGGYFLMQLMEMEIAWPVLLAMLIGISKVANTIPAKEHSDSLNPRIIRGASLATLPELMKRQRHINPNNEPTLSWGGFELPESSATRHFLVAGATGTGKTITIRLLMNQVLPLIQTGRRIRAVVYDGKGELPGILSGMGLTCPIFNMNPFDQRGYAWNLAEDITRIEEANQLAAILYPDEGGGENQKFFVKASRALIANIVMLLNNLAPRRWTFRDLILTAQLAPQKMEQMFARVPNLHRKLNSISQGRSFAEVAISVNVMLNEYEPIAAAWETLRKMGREISLNSWIESSSIMILPSMQEFSTTLIPLNQLLLARLSDLLLSQPDDPSNRTWFFLDEFADFGKVSSIPDLFSKGRSKGVAIVIGFQDIPRLQNESTGYGKDLADSILGQIHTRAYLKLEAKTAEWASQCLREQDRIIQLNNSSTSKGIEGTGVSEQLQTTRVVSATEIMALPLCGPGRPLHGYYDSSDYGSAWYAVIDGAEWSNCLKPKCQSDVNFVRLQSDLQIKDWVDIDKYRLHLSE